MTANTDGAMPELLPCPFCSRPVPDDLSDTLYPSGIYWRDDTDIGRHYITHSNEMARAEDDNKCWEMNCGSWLKIDAFQQLQQVIVHRCRLASLCCKGLLVLSVVHTKLLFG